MLALALIVALTLAACGLSGNGGNGGNDTGVGPGSGTATTTTTTTAASVNCGAVANGPRPLQNMPSAEHVEQCFAAAFTRCQAAKLLYTQGGVDTVTTHALAVVPQAGSGCHITDSRQMTLAGSGHTGPTTVLTCAGATQQPDGLHISGCTDHQDFTVAGASASGPVPVLSPVPTA